MRTTWLEASAGAGKTTFLLSQINFNIPVLYLTFSNAAAQEMQTRLDIQYAKLHAEHVVDSELKSNLKSEIGSNSELIRSGVAISLKNGSPVTVMTLHALAYKIILEKYPQKKISHESFYEKAQIELLKDDEFVELLDVIECNGLKDRSTSDDKNKKQSDQLFEKIELLIKQKEEELKALNEVLYYEDLLILAVEILSDHENIGIFIKIFGSIKLILVDEAQDLSQAQWNFLLTILDEWKEVNERLVVASDPKQIIYDFQGASLGVFEENKKRLAKISSHFEHKSLNLSYRLPIKVCEFVNNVGQNFAMNYTLHQSARHIDGSVEILKVKNLIEIIEYIERFKLPQNQIMILFKQRTDENAQLAQAFFANGFLLNSPYIIEHPILKDFRHLLRFLYDSDNTFSRQIVSNAYSVKYHDASLNSETSAHNGNANFTNEFGKFLALRNDLSALFLQWISCGNVYKNLQQKLGAACNFWVDILTKYCNYYRYHWLDAIDDSKDFYAQHSQKFFDGVFFNTIHSAKGKEANYVFFIEAERTSKFKNETESLLYVAITRTKQRLIIPILNSEKESNWSRLIYGAFDH